MTTHTPALAYWTINDDNDPTGMAIPPAVGWDTGLVVNTWEMPLFDADQMFNLVIALDQTPMFIKTTPFFGFDRTTGIYTLPWVDELGGSEECRPITITSAETFPMPEQVYRIQTPLCWRRLTQDDVIADTQRQPFPLAQIRAHLRRLHLCNLMQLWRAQRRDASTISQLDESVGYWAAYVDFSATQLREWDACDLSDDFARRQVVGMAMLHHFDTHPQWYLMWTDTVLFMMWPDPQQFYDNIDHIFA